MVISIHALVKRATKAENGLIVDLEISIHALVKRATDRFEWDGVSRIFQSTPS